MTKVTVGDTFFFSWTQFQGHSLLHPNLTFQPNPNSSNRFTTSKLFLLGSLVLLCLPLLMVTHCCLKRNPHWISSYCLCDCDRFETFFFYGRVLRLFLMRIIDIPYLNISGPDCELLILLCVCP